MRTARSRRGITFLEIMVVIVIIGILTALVLPNLAGPREGAALRTAARELSSAGLLARQRAITQREPAHLYLNAETGEWQLRTTPKPEDRSDLNDWEDGEAFTSEETERTLPDRISFKQLKTDIEKLDDKARHILTFYPNGSSSGMAIHLTNTREKTLTVEFDPSTGRPEVYIGEPKTFAQKLEEAGIDPALYGLAPRATTAGSVAGEGFRRSAGMNEDERVEYYKDAVDRMFQRSRNRYESQNSEGGPAQYYRDAARWGGAKQ